MKKTLRAFEKKKTESYVEKPDEGAVPAYLLDRKDKSEGKALSQQVWSKFKLLIHKLFLTFAMPHHVKLPEFDTTST